MVYLNCMIFFKGIELYTEKICHQMSIEHNYSQLTFHCLLLPLLFALKTDRINFLLHSYFFYTTNKVTLSINLCIYSQFKLKKKLNLVNSNIFFNNNNLIMEQIPTIRLENGSSWEDVIKIYERAKYFGLALYFAAIKIILPDNMLPQNRHEFKNVLEMVESAIREKDEPDPSVNIKYVLKIMFFLFV